MTALYGVKINDDGEVAGSSCARCGFHSAPALAACSVCGQRMDASSFRPVGTVWARTLIAFAVHGTTSPSEFAYVDLDNGPRLLVRNSRPDATGELAPGDPVRIGIVDGVPSVTELEGARNV